MIITFKKKAQNVDMKLLVLSEHTVKKQNKLLSLSAEIN